MRRKPCSGGCGKRVQSHLEQPMCQPCRRVTPKPVPHGTRLGYQERKCRCDECRAWKCQSMREYNDRRRSETGVSYTAEYKARQRRSDPAVRQKRPGACSKCDRALAATLLDDPVCAPCRGNLPGYNIGISRKDRLAIYERDGWTCQVCLDPVDSDVDPNTTWGATLDHVIPRSKGGSDEPDNLRLAHRWCNAVRGDLSYYADDDLRVA